MSSWKPTRYQTSTFHKWKIPYLLLQSLTDFLVLVLCNVHIHSHPMNQQQEQLTLLEGGKLWCSPLNGESLEPIVLPWNCHSGHIMELCDECNNCTKFQFYTEKVVRDIQFFVILHHLVSTLCHKSSNLHKSKGNQECYHNKINAILHHFESIQSYSCCTVRTLEVSFSIILYAQSFDTYNVIHVRTHLMEKKVIPHAIWYYTDWANSAAKQGGKWSVCHTLSTGRIFSFSPPKDIRKQSELIQAKRDLRFQNFEKLRRGTVLWKLVQKNRHQAHLMLTMRNK